MWFYFGTVRVNSSNVTSYGPNEIDPATVDLYFVGGVRYKEFFDTEEDAKKWIKALDKELEVRLISARKGKA
jgi:hypothetical protein